MRFPGRSLGPRTLFYKSTQQVLQDGPARGFTKASSWQHRRIKAFFCEKRKNVLLAAQRLWYAWKQWPTRPERSPWNLFRLPACLPACSALTSMHILTSQIFNPCSRSELYDHRHFPKAGSWSKLCIWWSNFQQERSSTCQVNFLTNRLWSPSLCFYTGLWQASSSESSQYFTLAWKLLQEARQPLGNIRSFWWRNFINRAEHLTPSSTSSEC